MNGRTLARRLDRLETKLNPTVKPGLTVIVVAAGEPEADLERFSGERQLDRLETKLNPTAKPGLTIIVERAGEPKIFHQPDLGRFRGERQNIPEGTGCQRRAQ